MTIRLRSLAAGIAAIGALLSSSDALALSIKEFRKYPADKQAVYITAAVSITAYTYASNGDVPKARCIKEWYFGKAAGENTPGPRELAIEIGAAEHIDAEKAVEGVILGVTDRVCGVGAQANPKR